MNESSYTRWTVLLRHDVPGKGAHLDWMIEREPVTGGPDERRMITFRLAVGTDPRTAGAFAAHRIHDHRAAYIEKQGDIGGGRGTVTRLWRERLAGLAGDSELVRVSVGGATVHGRCVGGVLWRFIRVTDSP